ncbi:MAG: hypothetical protein EAZ97_09220 [Bacteroidetes bacterium]|nr:MAG: hypothetical protein EAZ97_09220 [Bacteroidota bacterium]
MKISLNSFKFMFILLFVSFKVFADPELKQSKSFNRVFAANSTINVELINKYGEIVVEGWNKDSVKVEIIVTAVAEEGSHAQKMLDRVEINFSESLEYAKIETFIDRSKGTFTELINKIADYSKSVLDENNLQIDYKIYVPKGASLNINNKFGGTFIYNFLGKLNLVMSHGHLKLEDLHQTASLDLSFGSAEIKYLKDAMINLKISDLEIVRADQLSLTSHSSEIVLTSVENLSMDSRNDKIKLEKIANIKGNSNFTKLNIDQLSKEMDLKMVYGNLSVAKVQNGFSGINLDGQFVDMKLMIDKTAAYEMDIQAPKNKTNLSKILGGLLKMGGENNHSSLISTGLVNNSGKNNLNNTNVAKITIKANNGNVVIDTQ